MYQYPYQLLATITSVLVLDSPEKQNNWDTHICIFHFHSNRKLLVNNSQKTVTIFKVGYNEALNIVRWTAADDSPETM